MFSPSVSNLHNYMKVNAMLLPELLNLCYREKIYLVKTKSASHFIKAQGKK